MPADFSFERRIHALRWIRAELLPSGVDYQARLTAAVGLLIADDSGFVSKDGLAEAMQDPSIVQAARALLREARH